MKTEVKSYIGQVMDTDLRQLRIFKAVVECGGFAAAETNLNISLPAISVAMSDLETRLKLKLCQRGRAGFALTDQGRSIYDLILQLFTSIDIFKSQVNNMHSFLKGDLNIGIADNLVSIEHMNISKALATLKRQGPDVKVNIKMVPPVDIERAVMDGLFHVGVVPHINSLPLLEYNPLYDEVSFLYCSEDHPLDELSDIDVETVNSTDAVVSVYASSPAVKKIEQTLNATAEASDREGLALLILSGAYIGFLPSHYAERWVESGRLKALLPENFYYHTHYAAITRKGARPSRVVVTFMKHLVNN